MCHILRIPCTSRRPSSCTDTHVHIEQNNNSRPRAVSIRSSISKQVQTEKACGEAYPEASDEEDSG